MLGGKKQAEEEVPILMEQEGRILSHLNQEAMRLLGPRYAWFNKVREAKKGRFPFLGEQNLEEQMEATRSALQLLGRNLNNGLVLAFNSTVDGLKKADPKPVGLPDRIEVADRNNPPSLSSLQDALIIGYMPMRFINLGKVARDKGKGLDFYSEGLVKKLTFKVLAFYGDPANWDTARLGFFLNDLPEDAPLATINERLAPLKTEMEIFASSVQLFRFGSTPRGPKEAGQANTLEDTFNLSQQEQLNDLYLQSFIINGLYIFLFRYYVTLMDAAKCPRAPRLIANVFLPALKKAEELRIRFQASFTMERGKVRVRESFQEFRKKMDALPLVGTEKVKGRSVRKVNYTHRFLEISAFPSTVFGMRHHPKPWQELFARVLHPDAPQERGTAMLTELLAMMMRLNGFAVDGKLVTVQALRQLADEQEKLGQRQLSIKEKQLGEAKRAKLRTAAKFRSSKQHDMVKTIEQEAAELEATGKQDIVVMGESIKKRKEAMLQHAATMEEHTMKDGEEGAALAAKGLFALATENDEDGRIRGGMLQSILEHLQNDPDVAYPDLYKRLFGVIPDLIPTEKILLRKALATKIALEDDELSVSPEEMRAFQEQVDAKKTEIGVEAPGTLEQRFTHNTVNTTINSLLDAGLTEQSFALLMSLPFKSPNQPPAKLAPNVVQKLLGLNRLMHPFAENEIVLPNVEPDQPVVKRINFNRLSKLVA